MALGGLGQGGFVVFVAVAQPCAGAGGDGTTRCRWGLAFARKEVKQDNLMLNSSFILSIILMCFGFYCVWSGLSSLYRVKKLKNRVVLHSNLLDFKIEKTIDPDNNSGVDIYFYPEIRYSYQFNGVEHMSCVLGFEKQAYWSTCKVDIENKIFDWRDSGALISVSKHGLDPIVFVEMNKKRISHYFALLISGLLMILVTIYLLYMIFLQISVLKNISTLIFYLNFLFGLFGCFCTTADFFNTRFFGAGVFVFNGQNIFVGKQIGA